MFLNEQELRTLTGRARPGAQIAYLKRHRIRHYVNAGGRPVVAAAWLGVGHELETPVQPNFAAAKV